MLRGLLLALCLSFATTASAAKHTKMGDAVEAYRAGKFARAAELYSAALAALPERDKGTALERDAREKLVLSLYAAKKEEAAVSEYRELLKRFPDFHFDPDRVSPETVSYFDVLPKPSAEPESQPVAPSPEIVAAPASEPVAMPPKVIETPPPEKRWHWYYLMPLGIGQFLAGSPVRGTILLVLEVGLVAMNVVAFALLQRELRPDGTVPSVARAYPLQVMSNVGFFGWIGALALGIVDGAALEP
ncbi:MAG: hypothetical protein IT381_33475 [Deltaproteobacteria bacterium]|nr:hypothetical protein [Deltaproteobacteria bacterium]